MKMYEWHNTCDIFVCLKSHVVLFKKVRSTFTRKMSTFYQQKQEDRYFFLFLVFFLFSILYYIFFVGKSFLVKVDIS